GSATSNAAVVVVNGPPAFSAQPAAQTVFAGQPFTLTVAASGAGVTWQLRVFGIPIPGATSATYAKSPAAVADSGSYDCVASNPAGADTSAAALVTVNGPPAIAAQPADQALFATQTISLSVTATGV